jgi:hypothetical protein
MSPAFYRHKSIFRGDEVKIQNWAQAENPQLKHEDIIQDIIIIILIAFIHFHPRSSPSIPGQESAEMGRSISITILIFLRRVMLRLPCRG